MFKKLEIALLRASHRRALSVSKAYAVSPAGEWSALTQMYLDRKECLLYNKLTLAINPTALTRAW